MAISYERRCHCCGAEFIAFNPSARWCSSRCCKRAYLRRRRGLPEADWAFKALSPVSSRVHQPTLTDDDDCDLPAAWTLPPAGTEERIWHGTAIQRRQSDGFVNATAMCKAGGRLFADYARLARTQEYMAALADVVGEKPCSAAVAGNPITASGLIHTIQGGTPSLQGTWIHPRLAIDLARWISPPFAVFMDGWFLDSLQPALPPQPTQSLPINPEDLTEGVKVFATSRRQSVDLWREALHQELKSMINRNYSTRSRPDDRALPLLPYNTRYININPHFSRQSLENIIIDDRLITTHEILTKLGQPITRANEMHLSAALRAMGFTKTRLRRKGLLQYVWRPLRQSQAA